MADGLVKVESSNIEAVGFRPEDGVVASVLTVRFKGGAVYEYVGVSEAFYADLLRAESKGRFLQTVTRNRYRYPCRRVTPKVG